MKEVITLGEPMVVFMADVPGSLEDAEHFSKGMAGAEMNVAIGLSRLEHDVMYLTKLGNDPFGKYMQKFMANEKILTDGIHIDPVYQTGFYLKNKVLEGDPEIFYYRKNSAASHLCPEDVNKVDFTGAKWLHVTGISPALSESCRAAVFRSIERAREYGMTVSFDPNIRVSLWKTTEEMQECMNRIAALSDYILPGIKEGKILTGLDTVDEIADFYLNMGCKGVIIKNGEKGACYKLKGESLKEVAGYHVEHIVDTVGAGDGFATGMISGCLENLPMDEAVKRGNAIGAIVITSKGDNENLPTRDELKKFMENNGR